MIRTRHGHKYSSPEFINIHGEKLFTWYTFHIVNSTLIVSGINYLTIKVNRNFIYMEIVTIVGYDGKKVHWKV